MIVPPPCCRMTGMTACMADKAPKKLVSNSSWQSSHLGLRNGIQQTVSGVIDPDVDALEVMQRKREHAVDFLGVADVAGQGDGAFGTTDPQASRLGASRIARQQNHARSFLCKTLGNCLADSHGSARDHNNFARKVHARVVFCATRQVKRRAGGVT